MFTNIELQPVFDNFLISNYHKMAWIPASASG